MNLASQIYRLAAIAGIPIFIFGLIVNLLILYLFFFDKHFRHTSYKLMRISVISDVVATITSLFGYILIVDRKLDYHGGTIMCRTVLCFLLTSFSISMMNLCLIGLDRYFIIVKPLSSFYRNYKINVLVTGEVAIWLISVAANSPLLVFVGVNPNDTLLCDIPDITPSISVYIIMHATVIYILPTVIILAIYGRIIFFQRSYIRPGEVLVSQVEKERIKRKKIIKMLSWISLSYIGMSWPYFANIIGMAITRQSTFMIRQNNLTHFLLSFFTVVITTSITILNPFLYFKFDLKVRKRSIALLRRLFCMTSMNAGRPRTTTVVSIGYTTAFNGKLP